MFPALNQYPRPTLALARKRNKQRSSQRPKTQASRCRLKATSNGHLKASGFGSVGEAKQTLLPCQAPLPRPTGLGYRPSLRSGWSQTHRPPHSRTLKAPHRKRVKPYISDNTYTPPPVASAHPQLATVCDCPSEQVFVRTSVRRCVSDITNIMGGG